MRKTTTRSNDHWIERFKTEALPIVVQECHPEQVVLFGSRIRGDAREESDLDVVIVSHIFERVPFIRRMAFMLKKVRFEKHIDFLCYAPEEFSKIQQTSAIVQDALRYGEIIYTS